MDSTEYTKTERFIDAVGLAARVVGYTVAGALGCLTLLAIIGLAVG